MTLINGLDSYIKRHEEMSTEGLSELCTVLQAAGFDMTSEHSAATPARFLRYLQVILNNQHSNMPHITCFPNENPKVDQAQTIPSITFWSACSHHLLPFYGRISVSYLPNRQMVGLSKIAVLVRKIALGFWMQEHLAHAIADDLENHLGPIGIAVRIEATHTCQLLDVGQPPIPKMISTVLRGAFLLNPSAKAEFLAEVINPQ